MNLLLDTHVWLWWISTPERLGRKTAGLLETKDNQLFFSAASAWEIAIKHTVGRLPLPEPPATFIPKRLDRDGLVALNITIEQVLRAGSLPPHHNDPFDRLLIAQATMEKLVLVTVDPLVRRYDVQVQWAAN